MIIDWKFKILAVNPVNGNIYTENNGFFFAAKDVSAIAALRAAIDKCVEIGANGEHIESLILLRDRVEQYQKDVESRIPDTVGLEINRCLFGEGVDD